MHIMHPRVPRALLSATERSGCSTLYRAAPAPTMRTARAVQTDESGNTFTFDIPPPKLPPPSPAAQRAHAPPTSKALDRAMQSDKANMTRPPAADASRAGDALRQDSPPKPQKLRQNKEGIRNQMRAFQQEESTDAQQYKA